MSDTRKIMGVSNGRDFQDRIVSLDSNDVFEMLRLDWVVCHKALVEAQQKLENLAGRQSWLDAPVDISRQNAKPIPTVNLDRNERTKNSRAD